MGLDICIHKYEDFDTYRKKENKFEAEEQKIWNKAKDGSEDEKNKATEKIKELRKSLIGDESAQNITLELNSVKYPDHHFKIGYFRSSYNEVGINTVLSNLGVSSLHDIFYHEDDSFYVKPNWIDSLIVVNEAIEKLKQIMADGNNYRCQKFSWNELMNYNDCEVDDESKALEVFLNEKKKHTAEYGSYMNINGNFHLKKPLEIAGIIHGVANPLFNTLRGKTPCAYIVYKMNLDTYFQALEIVKETIEYVLNDKEEINKYVLHWSG